MRNKRCGLEAPQHQIEALEKRLVGTVHDQAPALLIVFVRGITGRAQAVSRTERKVDARHQCTKPLQRQIIGAGNMVA